MIGNNMNNFFDSLSKAIKKGYNEISEKAEEVTKIGRIKLEIVATKRDIEKIFVELGGKYYEKYESSSKSKMFKDADVKELVEKVKGKEEKLRQLKEKLEVLRREEGVNLD